MRQLAGRKSWYASVIQHAVRTCGKSYATPVVAEPVTDGFMAGFTDSPSVPRFGIGDFVRFTAVLAASVSKGVPDV
jgi:hypothetical protein